MSQFPDSAARHSSLSIQLFHYNPDEADRMMESTRTTPGRSPSQLQRLVVVGSLLGCMLVLGTGCSSFERNATTSEAPPAFAYPVPAQASDRESTVNSTVKPSTSSATPAKSSATTPNAIAMSLSDTEERTWTVPVEPGVTVGDATEADRIADSVDVDEPERYIARQFPDNYTLPPPVAPQTAPSMPPSYGTPAYGGPSYGAPGAVPPSAYSVTPPPAAVPGGGAVNTLPPAPGTIAPVPGTVGGVPGFDVYSDPSGLPPPILPDTRTADLIINGFPARTGRVMFGGAVNSDAGVTGQITVDERNFDITRFPRSFQDLVSGTAFRGAGQTFRIEAVPGSVFDRYTVQFADPNLLGYLPISMSVSGFLFDRRFNDWDEGRMGGRLSFGYRITPDLSVALGISGQNVEITRPRIAGVQQLDDVLGDNTLYSGEAKLIHDTRDSPIQASEGHYFEFKYEQAFGDYDYPRFETEYRKYFLLTQRADGSGKQTLSYSTQLGFSGDDTPLFENFFAGGYATLRGFDFRGASPVVGGVEVGGQFQWLNSVEYMFPLTADDAFRGVAFVDFGTVEQDIEINEDNFRVAPGIGLRVAIPMLGPAPLAFDFAVPVAKADTDDRRIFSFYMSLVR